MSDREKTVSEIRRLYYAYMRSEASVDADVLIDHMGVLIDAYEEQREVLHVLRRELDRADRSHERQRETVLDYLVREGQAHGEYGGEE